MKYFLIALYVCLFSSNLFSNSTVRDIVIIFGGNNARGAGVLADLDNSPSHYESNIDIWNNKSHQSGEWEALNIGQNNNSMPHGDYGLEVSLLDEMTLRPSSKLSVVKVTFEGTLFQRWHYENDTIAAPILDRLVAQIAAVKTHARNNSEDIRFRGIIYDHGFYASQIADTLLPSRVEHYNACKKLAFYLRYAAEHSNLPFAIFGESNEGTLPSEYVSRPEIAHRNSKFTNFIDLCTFFESGPNTDYRLADRHIFNSATLHGINDNIATYFNNHFSDPIENFDSLGTFYTYLLCGQSNMVGWGTIDSLSNFEKRFGKTRIWNNSEERHQVLKLGDNNNGAHPFLFGIEAIIGHQIYLNQLDSIHLVKSAFGGTSLFGAWNAEGVSMGVSLRRTQREVLQHAEFLFRQGRKPVYKSFVWIQGQSDSDTIIRAVQYEDNLRGLIDYVRSLTGQDQLKAIVTQTHDRINPHPYKYIVRAAQADVCNADNFCELIDEDECVPNGTDCLTDSNGNIVYVIPLTNNYGVHFETDGFRILGGFIYDALEKP